MSVASPGMRLADHSRDRLPSCGAISGDFGDAGNLAAAAGCAAAATGLPGVETVCAAARCGGCCAKCGFGMPATFAPFAAACACDPAASPEAGGSRSRAASSGGRTRPPAAAPAPQTLPLGASEMAAMMVDISASDIAVPSSPSAAVGEVAGAARICTIRRYNRRIQDKPAAAVPVSRGARETSATVNGEVCSSNR